MRSDRSMASKGGSSGSPARNPDSPKESQSPSARGGAAGDEAEAAPVFEA